MTVIKEAKAPSKLPEAKLTKLKEIADEYATITADIGRSTVQIHLLGKEMHSIQANVHDMRDRYDELIVEETGIHGELLKEFGPGEVNFETGEFIPNK